MVLLRLPSLSSWVGILTLIVTLLSLCVQSLAENSNQWIKNTDAQGQTVYLLNDRRPSLYTQNFGDCQGDSLINVTRFDAAYYKDNMTVLFHLTGNTAVANESLMCEFPHALPWGAGLTIQCTLVSSRTARAVSISRSTPAMPISTGTCLQKHA